jgi:uncharacterized protein (TIGR03435 family)
MRKVSIGAGIFLLCELCFGQTRPASRQTARSAFEVASLKPSGPRPANDPPRPLYGTTTGGPGTPDPSRVSYSRVPLRHLIMAAYGVRALQVLGPAWLDSERYDIVAEVPPGSTKEQVSSMLQSLLAERLSMTLHHESKVFSVFELGVAKDGPKLRESEVDTSLSNDNAAKDKNGLRIPPPGGIALNVDLGYARLRATWTSVAQLIEALEDWLDSPVVDRTGLTGKYDYSVEFSFS